jgi:hypothetical protein
MVLASEAEVVKGLVLVDVIVVVDVVVVEMVVGGAVDDSVCEVRGEAHMVLQNIRRG